MTAEKIDSLTARIEFGHPELQLPELNRHETFVKMHVNIDLYSSSDNICLIWTPWYFGFPESKADSSDSGDGITRSLSTEDIKRVDWEYFVFRMCFPEPSFAFVAKPNDVVRRLYDKDRLKAMMDMQLLHELAFGLRKYSTKEFYVAFAGGHYLESPVRDDINQVAAYGEICASLCDLYDPDNQMVHNFELQGNCSSRPKAIMSRAEAAR